MTDIWYTRIDAISEATIGRYERELGERFTKEISRYKLEIDRRSRIVARKLISMYLVEQGMGDGSFHLLLDEYKKPYIEGGPFFNITHSGALVAVCFSDQPVGIDVEEKKEMDWEPITELLHEEERRCLGYLEEKLDIFFRIWARKEAFLKALGSGILNGIGEDCILDNLVEKDNRLWYLQDLELDPDFAAAVCSPYREDRGNTIQLKNINPLLK